MLDWGVEESLGSHRFSGWSWNQRSDPSRAIKRSQLCPHILSKWNLFRDLGSTNHCPFCNGSLCSGCCRLLQQWWLNSFCVYIVMNLIVLCNYFKNQIVVRNINDGLWVKAIYWDSTSVYFSLQWCSVLLLNEIC